MIKDIDVIETNIQPTDAGSIVGIETSYKPIRNSGSLAGKFLIATPSLKDTSFARAVIYMCNHNQSGAMGLIVNYPIGNVSIDDVMEQLKIENVSSRNLPIHFGGPVDNNRGFIIHDGEVAMQGIVHQQNGVAVTSSANVLQAIANGKGPNNGMLVLGYSGWVSGQLESEMESGSWIVASATKQILFHTPNDMKWSMAISSLGFDVGNFSAVVGHA